MQPRVAVTRISACGAIVLACTQEPQGPSVALSSAPTLVSVDIQRNAALDQDGRLHVDVALRCSDGLTLSATLRVAQRSGSGQGEIPEILCRAPVLKQLLEFTVSSGEAFTPFPEPATATVEVTGFGGGIVLAEDTQSLRIVQVH